MIRYLSPLLIAGYLPTIGFAQDVVKDRKAYFPSRKHVAVGPAAIGVLLTDGQPVLSTEGRSGPPDQLVFSANGNSYRWVYVPTVAPNPQITNLQVPVGNAGQIAVYPALNLANPPSVGIWGITQPYVLVEVEVNGGRGSPDNDSFVATNMRVIENSKDYPLKVADAVKLVKSQYGDFLTKQKGIIDQTMKDLAKSSLNGKEPTGPREQVDLMYLTWLADSATLRVHFRTTISDGAYVMVEGGADFKRNPPALPLPPMKNKFKAKGQVDAEFGLAIAKQPPPRFERFKTGTTFGIEFGRAYVVNKKGEVVRTEDLPIGPFTIQLAAPPGVGGPRPLPPVEDK